MKITDIFIVNIISSIIMDVLWIFNITVSPQSDSDVSNNQDRRQINNKRSNTSDEAISVVSGLSLF